MPDAPSASPTSGWTRQSAACSLPNLMLLRNHWLDIGNVRPVYSLEHWNTGPWWVHDYRFGGGAGEFTDTTPARDTGTADPNAIDVLVGPGQQQSAVLDWHAHQPVAIPLLGLTE